MPSGQAEQVIVPGTSADLRLRGIQLRQVSLPLDFLCLLINLNIQINQINTPFIEYVILYL